MIKLKNLKFFAIVALMLFMASCFDNVNDNEVAYTPAREAALISEYLDTMINRGLEVDTTGTGIYIIDLEEGAGPTVQPGDSIGVNYAGYFLTGGMFDANEEVFKFVYKGINLIEGFDEAISYLNKGAKGYFLIPSSLAYGSTGSYAIPPYTPLLFSIELVDNYSVTTTE